MERIIEVTCWEDSKKENNYMSKKSGHKQNLMTVECLLTRIAKYANEPTKCLKEAQQIIKSNFLMVQGMPSGDKCTPEFAVRVLMDCEGNLIDCDHQVYGQRAEHRAARCNKSGSHGLGYGAGNVHCGWNPHLN